MSDDSVWADELQWKLSAVRQCVPRLRPIRVPERLDRLSLLSDQVIETEDQRDEWASIAESYRVIAEVALEKIAALDAKIRQQNALIKNMGDELMLRKTK